MDQKLTFLKREDIRTMAKDLARLQEEEAAKERERINKLKTEEKTEKYTEEKKRLINTFIPKNDEIRKEIPEPIPLPPKAKPSIFQKVFVRAIIVLSSLGILFLIGFGYWRLFVKNRADREPLLPGPSPSTISTPLPSPEESISPLVPPTPIFPVREIKIININSSGETLETGLDKISADIIGLGFYELVVRENEITLNFPELLEKLVISHPENLFDAVSESVDDFDFLLYQKDGNIKRHALVGKIKDDGKMDEILASWETLISEEGLSVFNKKIVAISSGFKTLNYKGSQIRFLTISKADLGACYTVINNYLVFATSLEAIKKIVDSNIMNIE